VELPSNIEIARVFESLQGEVKAEAAQEATRIAGAWVSYGAASWMNKALGIGIGGDMAPEALDVIEAFFDARGVAPRVELTAFADEPLLTRLAERGYGLVQIGSVFARALGDMTELEEGPQTLRQGDAPEVLVERVAADDEAVLREAISVVCAGFVPEGGALSSIDVAAAMATARLFGTETFVARVKGEVVGAGSSIVRHGVASLYGTSVKAEHRRRGLHQALMIERMRVAADQGATLAVVVSSPGGPTERNARRLGFVPSYTRLSLVRREVNGL
jgi:GNAT superfamily N-acetyltransferase